MQHTVISNASEQQMVRTAQARQPNSLRIDVTVNLTNGDEVELEGSAASLADLGPAVERIITGSGELEPHERWSSLVVVVVA